MIHITWEEIMEGLELIDDPNNIVYGIPKGGMIVAGFLKHAQITYDPNKANIILDDLIDSGITKQKYEKKFPDKSFIALIEKSQNEWIVFPWETDHPQQDQGDSIHENIIRMLQFIGEDIKREGLRETPNRIVRAWQNEIFSGYKQNPRDLLTHFDDEGYNQIILLKNSELYSMCEHHMLPFIGSIHVAYIPNGRIIGVSKLARLVDIYARRLQIQERIGEQVTNFLMNELKAVGAACIIEAYHLCMRMRGCSKQNSVMITSSVKGVFFDDTRARQELMGLIK